MATLVNICGTARSGSSLLDVMLGNGPNSFSCGEVYAYFRPYRTHHYEIKCPCGAQPCPAWERIRRCQESMFHARACEALGADFIVDSSKDLCWLLDACRWAGQGGLRVANIVIWKEPKGLAHSFWKRNGDIDSWRGPFVGYYSTLFQLGLPFFSVGLDALLKDPAAMLARICTAIGMEYFPGKERFWEGKQQHQLFGSPSIHNAVSARRSTLRSEELLPPEFLESNRDYFASLEDDEALRGVLDRFEQSDLRHLRPVAPGLCTGLLSVKRPRWYYRQRLRGLVRRYFPQRLTAKDAG